MDIKKRIKERGFTISEVAKQLGVFQPTLTQQLTGNPTVKRLQEIADIIGCTLPELVADDEDNNHIMLICPHCGNVIKLDVKQTDKR